MARDYAMGEWRSKNNKIEDAQIDLHVYFYTGDYVCIEGVTDFGPHPDGESYYFVKDGYENYIPRKAVCYIGKAKFDMPELTGADPLKKVGL